MNGTVEIVDSVPEAFARLIADRLGGIRRDPVSLALSGGTAKTCYQALAELTGPDGERPLDWSSVDVYLSDERCVPPGDADSNHRMIEETLLRPVGPTFGDHPMYFSETPKTRPSPTGESWPISTGSMWSISVSDPTDTPPRSSPAPTRWRWTTPNCWLSPAGIRTHGTPTIGSPSPCRPSNVPDWWCSPSPGGPRRTHSAG